MASPRLSAGPARGPWPLDHGGASRYETSSTPAKVEIAGVDGSTVIYNPSNTKSKIQVVIIEESIDFDFKDDAANTWPDNKKLRRSANINGTQQIQELLGCGNLAEAQRKALADEHTLDPSVMRDNILTEGSREFLTEIGPAVCQNLKGTYLQVVASSSTVCSIAPPASDSQPRSFMSGFDLADSTISRRIPWLASLLKLIISQEVPGLAAKLLEGIEGVNQQLRQGATLKTANYRVLVEKIQIVLQSLAFDKLGNFRVLLTSFAFRASKVSARDDGDEDSDEEDDILNGEASHEPTLRTASTIQIKSLTPSVAVQMLKAMMHIFKASLAFWLYSRQGDIARAAKAYSQHLEAVKDNIRRDHPHLREEQIQEQASSNPLVRQRLQDLHRITEDFNPLVAFENKLKGSVTMSDLAMLASKASTIEESEPSKEGKWSQYPSDQHGPRLLLGENQVDGAKLKAIGSLASQDITTIMRDLVVSSDEGARARLVRLLVFPASSDEALFSLSYSQGGSMVDIKKHPSKFEQFERAFLQQIQERPDLVVSRLEMMREWLIGVIYVASTGTLRTADLRLIDLGSFVKIDQAEEMGNVFAQRLDDGRTALLLATIVQKTLLEGVLVIPPFIARLLVLFLRFLVPACFRQVLLKRAIDDVKDEQARAFFVREEKTIWEKYFQDQVSRKLHYKLSLTGAVLSQMKNAIGSLRWHDIDGRNAVCTDRVVIDWNAQPLASFDSLEDVRLNLRRYPCKWLAINVNCRQLRTLSADVRNLSVQFLEAGATAGTEEQKKRVRSKIEHVMKVGERWLLLNATTSSGHHSFQTYLQHYGTCQELGGEGRRYKVSEMKLQTALVLLDVMETITGLPVERSTGPPGLAIQMRRPLTSLRDEFAKALDPRVNSTDFVKTLFAALPDNSPKQPNGPFQTMVANALFDLKFSDVLVIGPCGSGKTLAVTLPYALTPGPRSVLIVTPLRCLLETMIDQLRGYGFDADEFDASKSRFKPASFTNRTRSPDQGKCEFILCVTDALLKPELIQFLEAARCHDHLAAIILDEVHQVLVSSTFRPVMERVPALRGLSVPFIMLSGTCPPSFLGSVLSRLMSSSASCMVLRSKDDPTFSRRTINLIRVKTPESAALNLLKADHKGRTMVFCPTRDVSRRMAELVSGSLSGADVLQLDAESEPAHRQRVLDRVMKTASGEGRPLVVSCTKILAEGVDANSFNRVIVVGGSQAGVLDLVQMFGRGGRGSGGSQVECFLLFNRKYMLEVVYRSDQQFMAADDQQLLRSFLESDQASVQPIVTSVGISGLFDPSSAVGSLCGRVALKAAMEPGQLPSSFGEPCGKCNRCAMDKWRFMNALAGQMLEAIQAEEPPKAAAAATFCMPLSGCKGPTEAMKDLEMISWVIQNLKKLNGSCIICQGHEDHYPNKCQKLLETCFKGSSLPSNRCRMCFNVGHSTQTLNATLAQYKGSNKENLEQKRHDRVLNSCAVVYSEHVSYATFRPCSDCWLQHDVHEKGGSCATSSWTVRACFLLVWHCPLHRKRFWDVMQCTQGLSTVQVPKTWEEFMRWGVYGGGLTVQNAYRVVAYVIGLTK